jgi:hypothetical protein
MREEKARRRVESRTMHWWDEGASLAEIGSFDVYVDLVLVPPPFCHLATTLPPLL